MRLRLEVEVDDGVCFNRRSLRDTQNCDRLDLSTPRAMSSVVVLCAFGLVARRQMRVGRGLCEMLHNDANRDRFQNVAEQLRR